jgi:hypothetical protein
MRQDDRYIWQNLDCHGIYRTAMGHLVLRDHILCHAIAKLLETQLDQLPCDSIFDLQRSVE